MSSSTPNVSDTATKTNAVQAAANTSTPIQNASGSEVASHNLLTDQGSSNVPSTPTTSTPETNVSTSSDKATVVGTVSITSVSSLTPSTFTPTVVVRPEDPLGKLTLGETRPTTTVTDVLKSESTVPATSEASNTRIVTTPGIVPPPTGQTSSGTTQHKEPVQASTAPVAVAPSYQPPVIPTVTSSVPTGSSSSTTVTTALTPVTVTSSPSSTQGSGSTSTLTAPKVPPPPPPTTSSQSIPVTGAPITSTTTSATPVPAPPVTVTSAGAQTSVPVSATPVPAPPVTVTSAGAQTSVPVSAPATTPSKPVSPPPPQVLATTSTVTVPSTMFKAAGPSSTTSLSRAKWRRNLNGFQEGKWYKIRNVGDNSVVHLDEGKFICHMEDDEKHDLQLFRTIKRPNGTYRIMTKLQKTQDSVQVWDYLPHRGLLLQRKESPTEKFQQNWKSEVVPGFNSLYLIVSPSPESVFCIKNMGLGQQIKLVGRDEASFKDSFTHWYLEELIED